MGPEEVLEGGDRLSFVGVLDSVKDLRKIRGLTTATDQTEKLGQHRFENVGRSRRLGQFTTRRADRT